MRKIEQLTIIFLKEAQKMRENKINDWQSYVDLREKYKNKQNAWVVIKLVI